MRASGFRVGTFLALTALLTTASFRSASAQTWDGGGADNNWGTDANWVGDVAPVSDLAMTDIFFAGTTRLAPAREAPYSVRSVTFNAGAGAFVNSGDVLTVGLQGITNNSSNTQIFSNDVVLGTAQSWNAVTGNLTFNGAVDNGGFLQTIDTAANMTTTISGALTGAGGLTKIGDGTLILQNSDITGDTTLSAGTIRASAVGAFSPTSNHIVNGGILDLNDFNQAIKSLTGTGGVVDLGSATLTDTTAAVDTYAGSILGTGGLTMNGTGTLVLSGNNIYTGTTTILGGATLQAGSATGLAANSAYVVDNGTLDLNDFNKTISSLSSTPGVTTGIVDLGSATLTVNSTVNDRYDGTIIGTGGLTKNGTGTLTLTNDNNTYTGVTTIGSGSTLQLGNGGTDGDITGTSSIVDNGTLAINHSDAFNMTKNISGSGGLSNLGPNTTTLTGTNTYTGTTNIAVGSTLQVGNGGTTGTIGTGAVTDNGNLTINRSNAVTLNNAISGTGSFTQLGAGTTTLGGTNTYSGGTTVTAGTLQGTTSSLQGAITNNAAVIFNQTTTGTYADVMDGTGAVTKNGTGQVTFTGANTYTGATTVNAGRLNIDGSVTSNTTAAAAGTVGGIGTITGNLINNGTVTPGNVATPQGTLTVTGTYANNAGTQFNVAVDGANTSHLDVGGAATINGGNLHVDLSSNNFNFGQAYTAISTGAGVDNTFATAETTNNFVRIVQSIDGNDLNFTLLSNFISAADTFNQRHIAAYIDANAPGVGDFNTVFQALGTLDDAQVRAAFNQISGDIYPTLNQLGIENTNFVIRQIAGRLRAGPFTPGGALAVADNDKPKRSAPLALVSCGPDGEPCIQQCDEGSGPRWTAWGIGLGAGGSTPSDGNATSVDYGMGGVVAGLEKWMDDQHLIGVWGGYVGTGVTEQIGGHSTINGGQIGGYMFADDGCQYYTVLGGAQFDGYTTDRDLTFATIDRQASSRSLGWQGYGYLERGVGYSSCSTVFQPFVALQYIYNAQDAFSETGADSLDIIGNSVNSSSLRSILGARLQYAMINHTGRRTLPEVHAMFMHEYLDTDTLMTGTLEGGTTGSFIVRGLDLGREWGLFGGSFTWEMMDNWSMFVNYDCQVNGQATFHVGSGGLGHSW